MHVLLAWLFCGLAFADSYKHAPGEIPVYQAPESGARVLYFTTKGEDVRVTSEARAGFIRVLVNRDGKWHPGYMGELELEEHKENFFADHTWGFGAGGEYTYLNQGAKSFETTDQVHYTTTNYVSQTSAPFLALQMGDQGFWRLNLAMKQTHYKGKASTDITGAPQQDVILDHKFISLLLQKAWAPFPWKSFYFGAGLEVDKATSVALTLGGVTLPTSAEDQPTYFGLQGFTGLTSHLSPSLSLFGEARLGLIPNQSPAIFSAELSVGLLYWPQFN